MVNYSSYHRESLSLSWVWRSEGGRRREGKVWHRGWVVENIDIISNKHALNAAIQRSIGVGCKYWKHCIFDITSQSTSDVTLHFKLLLHKLSLWKKCCVWMCLLCLNESTCRRMCLLCLDVSRHMCLLYPPNCQVTSPELLRLSKVPTGAKQAAILFLRRMWRIQLILFLIYSKTNKEYTK